MTLSQPTVAAEGVGLHVPPHSPSFFFSLLPFNSLRPSSSPLLLIKDRLHVRIQKARHPMSNGVGLEWRTGLPMPGRQGRSAQGRPLTVDGV